MTPFEETLNQIKIVLDSVLDKERYTKINIQGCNRPGNTQLVFTIFDKNNNYFLEFNTIKNFRLYRPEGDKEEELSHINKYVLSFKNLLNYQKFSIIPLFLIK